MDREQKQKLEELKQYAKNKGTKQLFQKNVLLQECLTALDTYTIVDNEEDITKIIHLASSPAPEIHSHYDNQITIEDEQRYYIVWDNAYLPIIMTSGKSIRKNWDDVMAVAFDTYFVDVSSGKAIGIRH